MNFENDVTREKCGLRLFDHVRRILIRFSLSRKRLTLNNYEFRKEKSVLVLKNVEVEIFVLRIPFSPLPSSFFSKHKSFLETEDFE